MAPLSFANLAVYVRETTLTAGRTDIRDVDRSAKRAPLTGLHVHVHTPRQTRLGEADGSDNLAKQEQTQKL